MMSDLIWLSIRLTFITLCFVYTDPDSYTTFEQARVSIVHILDFFVNVVKRKILVKL